MGHSICLKGVIWKISLNYPLYPSYLEFCGMVQSDLDRHSLLRLICPSTYYFTVVIIILFWDEYNTLVG